jgi:hypothetical protein
LPFEFGAAGCSSYAKNIGRKPMIVIIVLEHHTPVQTVYLHFLLNFGERLKIGRDVLG